MAGNIRLYNTSGYVELQAPSSASAQVLELPTDSIKPGLVHLHTETFSAQSTISIDDIFSSKYDNYRVMFWMNASSSQSPLIRFRTSGSDNTSATYDYQRMQAANTTVSTTRSTSQTSAQTGSIHTVSDSAMFMDIFGPNLPYRTVAKGGSGDNRSYINDFSLTFTGNTQFDGFSLIAGSGTFTGNLRIYGYRNS